MCLIVFTFYFYVFGIALVWRIGMVISISAELW